MSSGNSSVSITEKARQVTDPGKWETGLEELKNLMMDIEQRRKVLDKEALDKLQETVAQTFEAFSQSILSPEKSSGDTDHGKSR